MSYDLICIINFKPAEIDIYNLATIIVMFAGFYWQRKEYNSNGVKKELEKKANKEWVESELNSQDKTNVDHKEEMNAKYDNIEKLINIGNTTNEKILKRIEDKFDGEILLNKETRKITIQNHTDIEVLKERINN